MLPIVVAPAHRSSLHQHAVPRSVVLKASNTRNEDYSVSLKGCSFVAPLACGVLWSSSSLRRRAPKRYALPAQQLDTEDEHAAAVRKWLQTMIVGMAFCPWAGRAADAGGIRIVTCTATSPEETLVALRVEAGSLQNTALKPMPGVPTTTLLVCPHVEEWDDFEEWWAFYDLCLRRGKALEKDFDCKIVAFHPHAQASNNYRLEDGDEIIVTNSDGQLVSGVVVNADLGYAEELDAKMIAVRVTGTVIDADVIEPLQDSESDQVIEVPDTLVKALCGREELQDKNTPRSMLGRAPRPVLHLLRVADLEAVDDDNAEDTLQRNARIIDELGVGGFERLLQQCGW